MHGNNKLNKNYLHHRCLIHKNKSDPIVVDIVKIDSQKLITYAMSFINDFYLIIYLQFLLYLTDISNFFFKSLPLMKETFFLLVTLNEVCINNTVSPK